MDNHRHACTGTPSKAVHVQPTGLAFTLPVWHAASFCICGGMDGDAVHRRPRQPHGMLGEGQPTPCVEMYAFTHLSRANQQSPPVRYQRCTFSRVALMLHLTLQTVRLHGGCTGGMARAMVMHDKRSTPTGCASRSPHTGTAMHFKMHTKPRTPMSEVGKGSGE